MILKSYELEKIDLKKNKFFLLYGENEGCKNSTIKKYFQFKFLNNIFRYEETEIINNSNNFFNSINTKSFFENEKLIIITRITDKIYNVIEEIIEKNFEGITLVLNATILEKKSKIRNFFEKNIQAVCIPFYADNNLTLSSIINNFFREKKIPISQETINLLVNRCRGDRQNLKNELGKIESYLINKNKISVKEILKLTNLSENFGVGELVDNCLAKNLKKIVNILNENNYSVEDCILIIRVLLSKTKRLLKLQNNIDKNNNIDEVISAFKPSIFWKDKEIIKKQIKERSIKNVKNLIYKINETELLIKKNSINSVNILSDFILSQSNNINN